MMIFATIIQGRKLLIIKRFLLRKLFKGGNYSRAETIRGNTVFVSKEGEGEGEGEGEREETRLEHEVTDARAEVPEAEPPGGLRWMDQD